MKNFVINLTLTLSVLFSGNIFAQRVNDKFGKISEEELKRKVCPMDSTAAGEVLFDKGFSYVKRDNARKTFLLYYERHFRIKVYDKDRFEYGDVKIPIYKTGNTKEQISGIKARTYKIVNGKIEKIKLSGKDIYKEELNENVDIEKFAFPSVENGVIVECKYTIISEFFKEMRNWRFQYEIPVRYSEYIALIPEFYNYRINVKGFDAVSVHTKTEHRNETFIIEYKTVPQAGGAVERGKYPLPSVSKYKEWSAENIPAFVSESYLTSVKDYIASIDFELESIQYPRSLKKVYIESWDNVDELYLESSTFGKKIPPNNRTRKAAEELLTGNETDFEKMDKIYQYVVKKTNWNNLNRDFCDQSFKKTLEGEAASSGEINILLISMLKAAKLNTCPVLLSTRRNGKIFSAFPTIDQFNYVIAAVTIDENTYFLDATEDILQTGMLPERCLNGIGRMLCGKGKQINLTPTTSENKHIMYNAQIEESGNITAEVSKKYKGYAAYDFRYLIKYNNEEEKLKKNEEISELKIENLDSISKPVGLKYHFESTNNISIAGNMIYLTPLLDERKKENPFKLEGRKYPVDYAYPREKTIIFQYIIPDNYKVSEIPKNTKFSLPENGADFMVNYQAMGNRIMVQCKFAINIVVFQYDAYPALKKFYDLVIDAQNQKIVLKKK